MCNKYSSLIAKYALIYGIFKETGIHLSLNDIKM